MRKIDGHELYAYVISGAKNVVVNEFNLNRINVFPVPDGDTGTNLSLTMNRIIEGTQKMKNVSEQIHHIASIALNNAYGNSGMIFAQYLNGLALAFKEKTTISPTELSHGFRVAFEHALASVSHPKEGTILTVMKDWSSHWDSSLSTNFEHVFEDVLKHLKEGVEKTKTQLKVLKDNNVVDAGAMAFFYFMEGVFRFIQTRNLDDLHFTANTLEWINEPTASLEIGDYRYCTQYMLKTDHPLNEIQQYLESWGDSLVINQNEDSLHIHFHTNEPHTVMKQLVKWGTVHSHKVDDMKLQAHMIHQKKSSIAIITDSIADLPRSAIDDDHLVVIPMNLIVDSTVYMDKVTMIADDFYPHLDDYHLNPSSSQPTSSSLERQLKGILNTYDEVIGIFVSSEMSGTYGNLKKILSTLDLRGKKVEFIDSKVNSVAQGLVVSEALRLKAEGKSFEEIVAHTHDAIKRVKIFVSVKDLKYMIKGGRVSKVTGFILSKLKLQPVISIDEQGKGIIPFKSLTQKSAVKSILKTIKKDMKEKGIERYALVYADHIEDLKEFSISLKKILNTDPQYIETISPIVGLNAGKGAFAIAYLTH